MKLHEYIEEVKHDTDIDEKTWCFHCSSSDAAHRYEDHIHCFSCGSQTWFDTLEVTKKEPKEVAPMPSKKKVHGGSYSLSYKKQIVALEKRGITAKTCQRYGIGMAKFGTRWAQVADYRDRSGVLVAQKLRFEGKEFSVAGNGKELSSIFFGQSIAPERGQRLIITEGELDAASVFQAFGSKGIEVVSVPNGAQGASKTFKKNLEWLEGFNEVIIMFDDDEPGHKAAKECAQLLSPNKAKIATLNGFKDANDALRAGEVQAIVKAVYNAKVYRPDGIVGLDEVDVDFIMEPDEFGYTIKYSGLNSKMLGVHEKAIHMFTAGSGIGKSTLVNEIASELMLEHGLRVGVIALEESIKKTFRTHIGIYMNKALKKFCSPMRHRGESVKDAKNRARENMTKAGITKELVGEAKKALDDKLFVYDHFGSLDSGNLLKKIKYFITTLECKFIVLDHISIVVSDLDAQNEKTTDERRAIDSLMTKLRSLVEETGVGILAVCHLTKAKGKGHEDGGQTSLNDLRGSKAIAQLSDYAIALERDQQGEEKDISVLRILKNRENGVTGEAGKVIYDHDTGRLLPIKGDDDSDTIYEEPSYFKEEMQRSVEEFNGNENEEQVSVEQIENVTKTTNVEDIAF